MRRPFFRKHQFFAFMMGIFALCFVSCPEVDSNDGGGSEQPAVTNNDDTSTIEPLMLDTSEVQTSFYVSETGSDTNSGTEGSPFFTLSKAIESINAQADSSKVYAVYIDGTVRGATLVENLAAKKLYISGKTSHERDILTLNNGEENSVLSLKCACQVVIVNVTITGGTGEKSFNPDWDGGRWETFGSAVRLMYGADLTLGDKAVVKKNECTEGTIDLSKDCTFTLQGGTITENEGRGIMAWEPSHIYIKTGVISKNNTFATGAGIDIAHSAHLIMEGGDIYGNTAKWGGGVSCGEGASFIMKGGTIRENTASDNAGGVQIQNSSTFTMEGGTIKENTAKNGGGILLWNTCTLILQEGSICDNKAWICGGGIQIDNNCTLELKGGSIYANEVTGSGGGIFCNQSTLTMTDGRIYENTGDWGGGACILDGSFFTMKGGSIEKNKSRGEAGGIALGGSMEMTGGTITGNYAKTYGGGILLYPVDNADVKPFEYTARLLGGTISENACGNGVGGAIINWEDDIYLILGGSISIPVGADGNNDVLLSSSLPLYIESPLTAEAPVATVTRWNYSDSLSVCANADDSKDYVSTNYSKFALTDPEWHVCQDGYMGKKNSTLAPLAVNSNSEGLPCFIITIPKGTRNVTVYRRAGDSFEFESIHYISYWLSVTAEKTYSFVDPFVNSGTSYSYYYAVSDGDVSTYSIHSANLVPTTGYGEFAIASVSKAETEYNPNTGVLSIKKFPEFTSKNAKPSFLNDYENAASLALYNTEQKLYTSLSLCESIDLNSWLPSSWGWYGETLVPAFYFWYETSSSQDGFYGYWYPVGKYSRGDANWFEGSEYGLPDTIIVPESVITE